MQCGQTLPSPAAGASTALVLPSGDRVSIPRGRELVVGRLSDTPGIRRALHDYDAVSRRHCLITVTPDGARIRVRDPGSANGTWLGDDPAQIRPGETRTAALPVRLRLGRMSIDDRTQDPGSSAVTQALGGSARIDAHVWEQDLKGGTERYVLCTDGVWGALEPAELRGLCASDRAPDQVVDAVVSAIYTRRAGDNCSIIVADITSTPVESVRGRHLASSPVRSVAVETTPAGHGRRAAR